MDYAAILGEYDVLEGTRLRLRRFELSDADDVYEYASDPEVCQFLTWGPLTQPEMAAETILLRYLNNPYLYAITLKESGKCIGVIDIRIDPNCPKGSFGYCLNRAYWGQGYTTEALELILELAFTVLQLNKVEGSHYAGNEASGRVQQKCGMIKEGVLRQDVWVKNRWWDLVCYGILRSEYLQRHNK